MRKIGNPVRTGFGPDSVTIKPQKPYNQSGSQIN